VTPVPTEEINAVVKGCLEKAALINYTKMSDIAKIEGRLQLRDIFPKDIHCPTVSKICQECQGGGYFLGSPCFCHPKIVVKLLHILLLLCIGSSNTISYFVIMLRVIALKSVLILVHLRS